MNRTPYPVPRPPELILALDVNSVEKAKYFVNKLYPKIKIFKVGIQLFTQAGPKIIDYINKKGAEVFLDLKFFDIPNTVANAVRAAVGFKVEMLTLHILGDEDMLKKAVEAAQEESRRLKSKRPLLIGVTVLTSKETNFNDVFTLAKIGLDCGLDGVVCSAREAGLLRQKIRKEFVIVSPGIRPNKTISDDQKRTTTISEAVRAGSNFLVIGRPILNAKDPFLAAKEAVNTLRHPNH